MPHFPFHDYKDLRAAVDGYDVEGIDAIFRKCGISKVNDAASEDQMNSSPRTEIERRTAHLPFGNTSSDEAFTAETDRFQFLVLIHYGQCYTGMFYIDRTTNELKSV